MVKILHESILKLSVCHIRINFTLYTENMKTNQENIVWQNKVRLTPDCIRQSEPYSVAHTVH